MEPRGETLGEAARQVCGWSLEQIYISSRRAKREREREPAVKPGLPLLRAGPWLALLARDRVQLQLDWVLGVIPRVALAPVVADCVGEDVAVAGEGGGGDAAADLGVALEAVLGVLVPEVECAVGACGAECAVLGVEGDCVDGEDFDDVALGGVVLAMALEGEVEAGEGVSLMSGY